MATKKKKAKKKPILTKIIKKLSKTGKGTGKAGSYLTSKESKTNLLDSAFNGKKKKGKK